MKQTLLIITAALFASYISAQQQIQNPGFEDWENIPAGSEPVNWNSFLTAGGSASAFAADQIEESTDVRPGTSGTKSVKIWSKSILSIIANGNLTLGKINMGSALPSSSSNYNRTITSDPDFNQEMTDKPDSIVFWVKFNPNGHSGKARMKAAIHDNYDYRDPEDAQSVDHVVASAILNYPSTNSQWERKAVPFEYDGAATDAAYLLITFTTSETPGGGEADDEVFIDDVELIYNPLSVDKNELLNSISIYPNPVKEILIIDNVHNTTEYSIHSVLGEEIMTGTLNDLTNKIETSKIKNGVYFLRLNHENSIRTVRFIKH